MDVITHSIYSLLHCIYNGHRTKPPPSKARFQFHQLISIGSHQPPAGLDDGREGKDEREAPITTELVEGQKDGLGSFMYQTIGHNLLPLSASTGNIDGYYGWCDM